ncbi:putative zinc protease [bacterium HR11]|nr:putative zinc protease [bacterium HR11]
MRSRHRWVLIGSLVLLVIGVLPGGRPTRAQQAPPTSWRDLRFPELPPFRPPQPQAFRLKNGLRVFVLEDHDLPLIRLVGYLDAGAVYEAKPGVAGLTGQLLRTGGTRLHTPDEVDSLLDQKAIEVEISIGLTNGRVTLAALREHFETGLALLAELLTSPQWDPERLEVAKRQRITVLLRENDDPEAIARREFQKVVFGPDTPYGRYPTTQDIGAIRREDLQQFYEQYVRPDRLVLGVWGDFSTPTLRRWLEKYLGDWRPPRTSLARPTFRPTRPGIFLVKKADVTQTKIRMGYVVPPFDPKRAYDRDIYALQVANVLFGQGLSSRLFVRVRSQLGLAYYAFSNYAVQFDYPGTFTVATATKAESTLQALRALKDELERIRREGVTDEEVQVAKEALINSFVFEYESPADVIFNYLRLAVTGLPMDYLARYVPNIQAVTRADVERVIRTYWKPEQMTILVVGTPEKFDGSLTSLGPVQEIPLGTPGR